MKIADGQKDGFKVSTVQVGPVERHVAGLQGLGVLVETGSSFVVSFARARLQHKTEKL